jgi:hypothetical protein
VPPARGWEHAGQKIAAVKPPQKSAAHWAETTLILRKLSKNFFCRLGGSSSISHNNVISPGLP